MKRHTKHYSQLGSYTKLNTDGSTSTLAATDVWLKTNPMNSIALNPQTLSAEIQALPDIDGMGNLSNLQQAMANKASLKALVQQFINPQLSTNERSALLNNIIYQWAGVENVDPTSRAASMIYGNPIGDARKLEALATTTSRVANDENWRAAA